MGIKNSWLLLQFHKMTTKFIVLPIIKYYSMKLLNRFIHDLYWENILNTPIKVNKSNQDDEKVTTNMLPIKKSNLWQRIKSELQGWSNKDADDSTYDDTQVWYNLIQ